MGRGDEEGDDLEEQRVQWEIRGELSGAASGSSLDSGSERRARLSWRAAGRQYPLGIPRFRAGGKRNSPKILNLQRAGEPWPGRPRGSVARFGVVGRGAGNTGNSNYLQGNSGPKKAEIGFQSPRAPVCPLPRPLLPDLQPPESLCFLILSPAESVPRSSRNDFPLRLPLQPLSPPAPPTPTHGIPPCIPVSGQIGQREAAEMVGFGAVGCRGERKIFPASQSELL